MSNVHRPGLAGFFEGDLLWVDGRPLSRRRSGALGAWGGLVNHELYGQCRGLQ